MKRAEAVLKAFFSMEVYILEPPTLPNTTNTKYSVVSGGSVHNDTSMI